MTAAEALLLLSYPLLHTPAVRRILGSEPPFPFPLPTVQAHDRSYCKKCKISSHAVPPLYHFDCFSPDRFLCSFLLHTLLYELFIFLSSIFRTFVRFFILRTYTEPYAIFTTSVIQKHSSWISAYTSPFISPISLRHIKSPSPLPCTLSALFPR